MNRKTVQYEPEILKIFSPPAKISIYRCIIIITGQIQHRVPIIIPLPSTEWLCCLLRICSSHALSVHNSVFSSGITSTCCSENTGMRYPPPPACTHNSILSNGIAVTCRSENTGNCDTRHHSRTHNFVVSNGVAATCRSEKKNKKCDPRPTRPLHKQL